MYLPIRTWMAFLFLAVAAFAPVAGQQPGWLVAYYAALFACWIGAAIWAVRRLATENLRTPGDRMLRYLRGTTHAPMDDPAGLRASGRARRRIILATDVSPGSDETDDHQVIVIADRRKAERRRRAAPCAVERRITDRRRYDIGPLLATQGWAEVTLLTSEDPP